jgi:hypothetical protein
MNVGTRLALHVLFIEPERAVRGFVDIKNKKPTIIYRSPTSSNYQAPGSFAKI